MKSWQITVRVSTIGAGSAYVAYSEFFKSAGFSVDPYVSHHDWDAGQQAFQPSIGFVVHHDRAGAIMWLQLQHPQIRGYTALELSDV